MLSNHAEEPSKTRGRRSLVLGLVAACALIAAVLIGWRFGEFGTTKAERVRRAVAAREWPRVVALTDDDASQRDPALARPRLRALFRLGRTSEAESLLRRLPVEELGAEDFLLFARMLMGAGRTALGWVALDAAIKIDPKYNDAVAYMDAVRGTRGELGLSAAQVDRLASAPDGRALGEIVIGLALESPSSARATSAPLERLASVDRETLLKLSNPAAGRKLIARLLLEDGRIDEAVTRLGLIEGSEADQETNWLLSRGLLASGRVEPAVEALHRAGDFHRDAPMAPEPSRYAGARRCAECHGAIYRSQQSSRHAETITRADQLDRVKLPDGPIPDPADPRVVHRFERRGGGIEATARVDGQDYHALVAYALGSGNHGQTMIARDDQGKNRPLRISSYAGGKTWDLTEKFRPMPTDPHGFLGDPIGEKELVACLNCHTTRFATFQTPESPETRDRGIGCERCHGPGALHLRAIEAGFPEPVIARPKRARGVDRMALCARCHAANGEIPPIDPRFIRFESTTLPYSRCYTKSQGKLDCITCHNPHENASTDPAFYERACLSCHQPEAAAQASTRPASAPSSTICPVNPRTGCVGCHMPKNAGVMPGSAFTDHHIRVHAQVERRKALD